MRDRIIKAMHEKNIYSMSELERQADIPAGTMRNLGQGHMPSMPKIKKIASLLGVSVDWLVYGEEKEEQEATVQRNITKLEPEKREKISAYSAREFARLVGSLNDQNMEILLDYLRYLVSKQERD